MNETTLHSSPLSTSSTQSSSPAGSAAHGESTRNKAHSPSDQAGEILNQVTDTLNTQCEKVMDYSQKNPGTAALIALGAGIGVGLLLGNTGGSRNQRLVAPIVTALSAVAYQLFA